MGFLIDLFRRAISGYDRGVRPSESMLEHVEPCLVDGLERRRHWAWQSASSAAQARGVRLLMENVSPSQRAQFEEFGYFDVIGGGTGIIYRICKSFQANVHPLDEKRKPQASLCFMPDGALVVSDVMLAQKLALELFESDALRVANKFPIRSIIRSDAVQREC